MSRQFGHAFLGLLTAIVLAGPGHAEETKPRARAIGVPFEGAPGRWNAITDVGGVEVGHTTLISGEGKLVVGKGPVRTGVTAILPRGRGWTDDVFAGGFALNGNGQTTTQAAAVSQLGEILSLLNTQVGNNYIFSGSATTTPSVASSDEVLNGNGAQAGLVQVINERAQADLGTGSGRLVVGGAGSSVSLADDSATSPFGFKVSSITSNLILFCRLSFRTSPPTSNAAKGQPFSES